MTSADALLAGLTDQQREAVTIDAAPLLVVAGAGTGKTRVLTRRIAWQAAHGRIDPRRVLAVTFTRKAASELRARLAALGLREQVTAGTFHALAFALLRRLWLDRGQRPPTLLEGRLPLVASLLRDAHPGLATAVAREIEWAKARLVPPEAYEQAARAGLRPTPLSPGEVAAVYELYEREKRRRGLVDFDDLLERCAAEIERDAELAAVVRWRFRHFFVDEFQDLNPAQFRLLRAWLGDRVDLCAVGDGDQAIYGFGGADARYLTDFAAHFGERATVLHLRAGFRSSPQVVAVAGAVLGRPETPRPVTPDGPVPRIVEYESDGDEAAGVASLVARLRRDGLRWGDVAVLVRTNAQCPAFVEAFGAARIPCRVRGVGRFLDRPEVRWALRYLADAERASPGLPFEAHVEALGREELAPAPALASLLEMADEYASTDAGTAGVEGFRAFVAASTRRDDPLPSADAVEVLTFHRAKGLEWPAVFVTGLEDGLVPLSRVAGTPAEAEERRLLHVALTRAGRHLVLSWARRRRLGDRTVARRPSPYLAALAERVRVLEETGADGDGAGGRATLDAMAARLQVQSPAAAAPGAPGEEVLLDRLRQWRRHRARAAGVTETAILDDEALRRLATERPTDEAAVARVCALGPARLSRYGPEIIALVSGYAEAE